MKRVELPEATADGILVPMSDLPPTGTRQADSSIVESGPGDGQHTAFVTDRLPLELSVRQSRHIEVVGLDGDLGLARPATPAARTQYAQQALLAAAVAVLAARHTGQESVTLTMPATPERARDGEDDRTESIVVRTDSDGTFAALHAGVEAYFLAHFEKAFRAVREAVGLPAAGAPVPADSAIGLGFASLHPVDRIERMACDVAFVFLDLTPDRLFVRIVYDEALFFDDSIRRLGRQLATILQTVSHSPGMRLCEIELLDSAERRLLLETFLQNSRDYPVDRPIVQFFARELRRAPDATAVEFEGECLTYAELNERVDRLVQQLRAAGVGAGAIVPILHERNPGFVVATLAVLELRAAFLPLDPKYPADRLEYLIRHSGASVVVTESEVRAQLDAVLEKAGIRTTFVTDNTDAEPANSPGSQPRARDAARATVPAGAGDVDPGTGSDPAYLIYTSGSTGLPKGILVRQDAAVNHVLAEVEILALGPQTRFLQTAQLSTDLCVWQFLAPLMVGGTCVIARLEDVIEPGRLFNLLRESRSSLVELVPVVFGALLSHVARLPEHRRALPDLRWLMLTGEATPVHLLNEWFRLYPDIPVVNAYGPSEVADDTAQMILTGPLPTTARSLPVGSPLPNLQVFILDTHQRLVPVGVAGELCVSGIGVAHGYWRDEARTHACFVANPILDGRGKIMYRTGDLGRWLPDGTIELLGRADHQVKIRGFRIELGEIENVLGEHPAVEKCAVLAREDAPGQRRLVAYVVPRETIGVAELRGHLARKLPSYMCPTAYVFLDAFPMTANGVKLDRRALPAPPAQRGEAVGEFVAPRNEVERTLAQIWASILGLDRVGCHDDFFELGGDSMMTVEVALAAATQGLDLCATAMFEFRTIGELASVVRPLDDERAAADDPPMAPAQVVGAEGAALLGQRYGEIEAVRPPAPTQLALYVHRLMNKGGSGVYVEQMCGVLDHPGFDPVTFERAWHAVIRHHPALRTVFVHHGLHSPHQVVLKQPGLDFRMADFRSLPAGRRRAKMAIVARSEVLRDFRFSEPPLMRVVLNRLSESAYQVIWTYPHILMDGWSEAIVLRQVLEVYGSLERGEPPRLPLSRPTARYDEWLAHADLGQAESYWRRSLQGFDQPVVLPAAPPPNRVLRPSKRFARIELHLSPAFSSRMSDYLRSHGLTVNTLLQGAWGLVLGWWSQRTDVVFGAAVSGRQVDLAGVDTIVGMLVNSIPVRIGLDPGRTADEWLYGIQQDQFAMRRHEHAPLRLIKQWSGLAAGAGHLFSTYFVFANYPNQIAAGDGAGGPTLRELEFHTLPEFPITLFAQPGSGLLLRLLYDETRFRTPDMDALLQRYAQILAAVIEDPRRTVGSLLTERAPEVRTSG